MVPVIAIGCAPADQKRARVLPSTTTINPLAATSVPYDEGRRDDKDKGKTLAAYSDKKGKPDQKPDDHRPYPDDRPPHDRPDHRPPGHEPPGHEPPGHEPPDHDEDLDDAFGRIGSPARIVHPEDRRDSLTLPDGIDSVGERAEERRDERRDSALSSEEERETCLRGDATCLKVRFVVYRERAASRDGDFDRERAARVLQEVNSLWSGCEIRFVLDEFESINPRRHRLNPRTANYEDLESIRRALHDDDRFLVAITDDWDRRGSLGNNWANAWTTMPGPGSFTYDGAILERRVGEDFRILAHELGHYLGLDHESTATNLMSPVVYRQSTVLDRGQCEVAERASRNYWRRRIY